jgi:hypothetical protein
MLRLKQKNVGNDVGDVGKDNNGLVVDFFYKKLMTKER